MIERLFAPIISWVVSTLAPAHKISRLAMMSLRPLRLPQHVRLSAGLSARVNFLHPFSLPRPLQLFLPISVFCAAVSYAPGPTDQPCHRSLMTPTTLWWNRWTLTQALHSVRGPSGPRRHSGVSVAPHPKHCVGWLFFPSGCDRFAGTAGALLVG